MAGTESCSHIRHKKTNKSITRSGTDTHTHSHIHETVQTHTNKNSYDEVELTADKS